MLFTSDGMILDVWGGTYYFKTEGVPDYWRMIDWSEL